MLYFYIEMSNKTVKKNTKVNSASSHDSVCSSASASSGLCEAEVIKIMEDALTKNKKDIESALIKPISPEWPFSTNGVYFFLGKMGSGKTHNVWKHIFMTERLGGPSTPDLILFCSTSGALDKTSETFAKMCKIPIRYLKENELMSYLNKFLKRKLKYYAMVKHLISNLTESSEEMNRLIKKYSLIDLEDRLEYIAMKLRQYSHTLEFAHLTYPLNTLLVLDDFAGSPLLRKSDSPLVRMLTKTRHYNLTAIIVAQTIRFVPLNLKRLATDVILYSKYSDEDFLAVLEQTPNNLNKKQALAEYHKLTGSHDHMIINITADKVQFVRQHS